MKRPRAFEARTGSVAASCAELPVVSRITGGTACRS